ncbi:MAG: hypothetical protein WA840_11995 [Caulobacteraceae bacterium]
MRFRPDLKELAWGAGGGALGAVVVFAVVALVGAPGFLHLLDAHEGAGGWIGALANVFVGVVALVVAFAQRHWQRRDRIGERSATNLGCCSMALLAIKLVDDLQDDMLRVAITGDDRGRLWSRELADGARQVEFAIGRYPVPDRSIIGWFLAAKSFADEAASLLEAEVEPVLLAARLGTQAQRRTEIASHLREAMAGFLKGV